MRAWSTTSAVVSWMLILVPLACGSEQSDDGTDPGSRTGGAASSGAAPGAGGGTTSGRDDAGSSGGTSESSGSGGSGVGGSALGGTGAVAGAVELPSGGSGVGGGVQGGGEGGEETSSGGGPVTAAGAGGSGVGGSADLGVGGLADTGGSSTGGSNATGGAAGSGAAIGTGGVGNPLGGAGGVTSETGGTGGVVSETGGTGGVGGATGGAGTGGTFEGCTPGSLDETATCNTPQSLTGEPGDEVDCVGELEGRWGSIYATIAGQQYFLQVNEWGSSEAQTMAHGGDYFFRMTVQQADTGNQGQGAPTGFPSVFIGSNGGHTTAGSNLPIAISAITSAPTTWIWNDNGALADTAGNIFNAAYDVWFNENTSQSTQSGPTGGYLMVWLYDPPNAEPIGGSPAFTDVTLSGIDGTWDIWIGLNGTRPCISYVRTEMTYQMSFDLKDFIDDATTRAGGIDAGWALTNVFAGFEIWSGSQGVETTAFCAFAE